MPSGNFDEPADSPTQPVASARSFRLPADYYSAPLAEVKPFFPAWVPWGCGGLAALVLLLMFAGSAALSGPRLATLFDFVLGMSIGEMKYAAGVPDAAKEEFQAEAKAMREKLRDGTIPVQSVQPFLQAMQKAIADEEVTAAELENLTKLAREIKLNSGVRSGNST